METFNWIKSYIVVFCRWLFLGVLLGTVCGALGAGFAHTVSAATALREQNTWLLFGLPVFGLLSVALYKVCCVTEVGTGQVFESIRSEKSVPFLLAPAVFVGSVLTHLGGGSAGREGAALQLGGSISALISKWFRLDEDSRHILTICGMGALFSAVFGTPIGACVFALEVICVGRISLDAIFPGIVSSVTAYFIAVTFGVVPERFLLASVPEFSISVFGKVAVIAVAGAAVSVLFCHALHFVGKKSKQLIKNDFLRVFLGGVILVLLTVILGTSDYNGGGIEVIQRVFEQGTVRYEAFLIKLLFTVITVAAGFKGGEIIPSLFIGATLGASLAILLGLDPAFGAAIGMVALFCGVTNCPLATILLSVELFGAQGMVCIAVSTVIAFVLSGNSSLYSSQQFALQKVSFSLKK